MLIILSSTRLWANTAGLLEMSQLLKKRMLKIYQTKSKKRWWSTETSLEWHCISYRLSRWGPTKQLDWCIWPTGTTTKVTKARAKRSKTKVSSSKLQIITILTLMSFPIACTSSMTPLRNTWLLRIAPSMLNAKKLNPSFAFCRSLKTLQMMTLKP